MARSAGTCAARPNNVNTERGNRRCRKRNFYGKESAVARLYINVGCSVGDAPPKKTFGWVITHTRSAADTQVQAAQHRSKQKSNATRDGTRRNNQHPGNCCYAGMIQKTKVVPKKWKKKIAMEWDNKCLRKKNLRSTFWSTVWLSNDGPSQQSSTAGHCRRADANHATKKNPTRE